MTDWEVKGSWQKTKGKLKQKLTDLTNNDTMLLDSKKDEVIGRLQIRLGKTKEELLKIIEELY